MEKVKEREEPFARGVWVGFTFGKNGPGVKALDAMNGDYDDNETFATIF